MGYVSFQKKPSWKTVQKLLGGGMTISRATRRRLLFLLVPCPGVCKPADAPWPRLAAAAALAERLRLFIVNCQGAWLCCAANTAGQDTLWLLPYPQTETPTLNPQPPIPETPPRNPQPASEAEVEDKCVSGVGEAACLVLQRDAAAVALSLLHRSLRAALLPWRPGAPASASAQGGGKGGSAGEQGSVEHDAVEGGVEKREAGDGMEQMLGHMVVVARFCLGGGLLQAPAAPVSREMEVESEVAAQEVESEGAGAEHAWGVGVGWGCLRRKCVAVLLASDLGER
jgi:hypothetical protein